MPDDLMTPEDFPLVERTPQLGAVMDQTADVSPVEHAKALDMSRRSGQPLDAVKFDPTTIDKELRMQEIDKYAVHDYPHLHAALANVDTNPIMKDDLENVGGLEKVLTPIAQAGSAVMNLEESLLRVPQFAEDVTNLVAQNVEKTGLPAMLDPIRGLQTIAHGYSLMFNPAADQFQRAREAMPQVFDAFKRVDFVNQKGEDAFNDALKGNFGKLMDTLTDPEAMSTYFASATPSLLVAMATGGSFPAVATMEGGNELVNQADFEKEHGPIPLEQKVQATMQTALINGMLEKYGVDYLRKFPLFSKLFKEADARGVNIADAMKTAGVEGGTEAAQQFNQNMADLLAYNPDQSLTSGVFQSMVGGGLAGGMSGAAAFVHDRAYNKAEQAAFDSTKLVNETDQQKIDRVNFFASKSKARQLDPATFKQHVSNINDESAVYLDGEAVRKYIDEQSPEEVKSDPALKVLKQSLDNSEPGTDVSVKMADFATDIAGSKHYDALRQNMKLNPESSSPAQQSVAETEMKDYASRLMNEAQQHASAYVDAQDIFANVRDQLIDTGRMTPQQASVAANIVPAWAVVQSVSRGIPVAQVYAESGLKIEGPQTGKKAELKKNGFLQRLMQRGKDLLAPGQKEAYNNVQQADKTFKQEAIDWSFLSGLPETTQEESPKMKRLYKLYGGKENYGQFRQAQSKWLAALGTTEGEKQAPLHDVEKSATLERIRGTSQKLLKEQFGEGGPLKSKDQMRGDQPLVWKREDSGKIGQFDNGYSVEFSYIDAGTKQVLTKDEFDSNPAPKESVLTITPTGETEAALRLTVSENGELVIHGPDSEGEMFKRLLESGAAELAKGEGGQVAYYGDGKPWTRLNDVTGPQLARVLAETHAMLLGTSGQEHTGLYWTRATGATGAADLTGRPGGVYLQNEQDQARGYYDAEHSIIGMTEASDLSTFLHEFAHFMLDMEMRNPESKFLGKINQWFARNAEEVAKEASGDKPGTITAEDVTAHIEKGTTGDTTKDEAITRATHEQFARGFEKYLMEGVAPSIELRNVFRTFARWLTQVYKSIRGDMRVNLDQEMRDVFARLLATDEQIAAAETRSRIEPMFTDAAMAGMTEEEYQKYQDAQEKVKDKAEETLRDKIIKQLTRQTEKWWREERADIAIQQEEELKKQRVYAAADQLRNGEIKLDTAMVKEKYSEQRTDRLNRTMTHVNSKLSGMTASGGEGVNPDVAAAMLGYDSGDEMIQDIINAKPIKEQAKENAQQIMLKKHGDILTDGTIEKEADEAVQNEERGKVILMELKALSKGLNKGAIDRQTMKSLSEDAIGRLNFRQIQPGKYRAAELKAAQEAASMLAKGNKEGAFAAKSRQVMNYYLGMAATNAKNDTTKIIDRMARYRKKDVQQAIQKAGNDYWPQLAKILARFEFRKSATLGEVDKTNESINSWMKKRIEEDGDGLVLSAAVLDEGYVKHWKNVPYGELVGINDSVRNIEHVARYGNKIKAAQEEMEFQQFVQKWTDSMRSKVKDRFPAVASVADKPNNAVRWGRWAMAQMTKIPYLASWMDGGERTGISHDVLVQPFTDAYDEEARLWHDVGTPVMNMIRDRSKEDIKRHNTKVFIPEIKGTNGHSGNLMGHEILAIALNTGNMSNMKKMLLGEGWANPDSEAEISFQNPRLQAVLKHMTKSDWDMVQQIWDQMDKLYPMLSEVYRRTTGLTPPKIEATPVKTQHGEYNGGYYPVKYDPARSHQAQINEDKLNAETDSMFGSMGIQASVNASATNERTGYYAPIRLSLDVVPNHFQETIHYITHHDAVRQVNKLIRNASVASAIKETMGPDEFAQLKPWLNDIAKDGRNAPNKNFIESVLQRLRFGSTLVIMGFKASTGLMQLLGLSNTVAEVGYANTLQAVRSILGSPKTMQNSWDFASANSKVLNHRVKTMDREIKNAMTMIEGNRGIKAAVQEASMKHIALIQTYMVDLPTWHAAYIKGMKDWGDETRAYKYADWTVENIQGSGLIKDMAQIMRNQSQAVRMMTMFMTFMSSLWNMERDTARGAKSGMYSKTTVAAKLMFIFVVPTFLEALLRGQFGGDDKDPEAQLQQFLTNVALYPVQSIPFVRDIAEGIFGDYGYNISPVASEVEKGLTGMKNIASAPFTDHEISKYDVKGTAMLGGAALGIPGLSQAWATGEHLYGVAEKGEDLTLKQLMYGPERKNK